MLTYAGMPLIDVNEELDRWVTTQIDPSWSERTLSRTGDTNYDFLGQQGLPPRGPQLLNTLVWPSWGTMRWAEGIYLVDDATLTSLRQVCYQSGVPVQQLFTFDDGRKSVSTYLYMLPARLITQPDPAAGSLWLITLVDQRYFWWFSSSNIAVTAGTTTWTNLYNLLAAELGISITIDAVDSRYLKPPDTFSYLERPVGLILDSVASSVGQRMVFGLDGSIRAMSSDSSLAAHAINIGTYIDRLAGGVLSIVGSTGIDAPSELPDAVVVSFLRDGTNPAPYVSTVTLSSLVASDQIINSLYPNVVGFLGEKPFRSSAQAGNDPTPDNQSELDALALALATDYYKHRAGRVDQRFEGAQAWTPEGLTWEIEYEHRLDRLSTRVCRGPSIEFVEGIDQRSNVHPIKNYYYYNTTIVYENVTVNFVTNTTWTISTNFFLNINGPGYVIFNAGVEICGLFAWCYWTYDFTANINNWVTDHLKVVYRISTNALRELTGITPTTIPNSGGQKFPRFLAITHIDESGEDPGRTSPLWIRDASTGSSSGNKFRIPGHSSNNTITDYIGLGGGDSLGTWYDEVDGVNRILFTTADIARQQVATVSGTASVVLEPSTKSLVVVSHSGVLSSVTHGQKGRHLIITNQGPDNLTIPHDTGAASTGDTFFNSTAANITLLPNYSLEFVADNMTSDFCFWRDTLPFVAADTDVDEKVKVSSDDTTSDYLENKVAGDSTITITEMNEGGNEYLQFHVPSSAAAFSGARIWSNATQAISSSGPGSGTTVTYTSSLYDTDGYATGSGQFTAPFTGYYAFGCSVRFHNPGSECQVGVDLLVGSKTVARDQRQTVYTAGIPDHTSFAISSQYKLTAGDTVSVRAFQDSGGSLNLESDDNFGAAFWIQYLGS